LRARLSEKWDGAISGAESALELWGGLESLGGLGETNQLVLEEVWNMKTFKNGLLIIFICLIAVGCASSMSGSVYSRD